MDGPAKSRLRWHLRKARDLIDVYRWQLINYKMRTINMHPNLDLLKQAQTRVTIAEEIYDVIKGARCVKIREDASS